MCAVLGPKLNPNTVFLNYSGNIWGRVLSRPWITKDRRYMWMVDELVNNTFLVHLNAESGIFAS